jgi:hypothetical protein
MKAGLSSDLAGTGRKRFKKSRDLLGGSNRPQAKTMFVAEALQVRQEFL